MFPYEGAEARAAQKMGKYRAEADRYRRTHGDGPTLIDRWWPAVRNGFSRIGLGRIGRVLSGRESGPILPAT
jgi:hypothetical protein